MAALRSSGKTANASFIAAGEGRTRRVVGGRSYEQHGAPLAVIVESAIAPACECFALAISSGAKLPPAGNATGAMAGRHANAPNPANSRHPSATIAMSSFLNTASSQSLACG